MIMKTVKIVLSFHDIMVSYNILRVPPDIPSTVHHPI